MNAEAARLIREYAHRTHQKHDIRVGCPRCDLTAALLACAIEVESANADTPANDGERRHLPECNESMIPDFHNERWICICDRIRACEQRVRMEDDDYAYVAAQAEADGRWRGWSEALDAAREVVDRLASDMANWSSAETAAATEAAPDLTADQWMWAQRGVHRSLAAIDALRGER